MEESRRVYKLSIATDEVANFLADCESSEWYALDTGERIMTETGPDAEAVLLVEPVARTTPRRAEALIH